MLQQVSEQIKNCYERAAQARRRAAETSDPEQKDEFLMSEQGWLRLAESYALSERLERFLIERDSKNAIKDEWQPISSAPFDRNLEVAVIKGTTPHALAFACRRILHGWIDANTRKQIKLRPTHWREWSDRAYLRAGTNSTHSRQA